MNGVIQYIKINRGVFFGVVGILLAVLFLYSPYFFFGYNLSPTNLMYSFTPWNSENAAVLGPLLSDPADSVLPNLYNIYHNGMIGLWDNMTSLGIPAELGRYLYPLNWIYILPYEYAIIIRSISEYLIAFFSMYFLLKSMDLEKKSCIIGGIIYTFSSVMLVWHLWPHSDVASFAPLTFLFARNIIFKKRWRDIVLLGYVEGIMLLAAMPTYVAYFDYLLGAYFVYLTIKTYKTNWKMIILIFLKFGIGIILGVLISLPYTIGILDSTVATGYSASRASKSVFTMDLKYIASMLFPLASLGNMHLNESTIYAGTLSIVLLPMIFSGLKRKMRKDYMFWMIGLVILFFLIFSHYLDFIFTHMPAINTSSKSRIIVLVGFIFAIMDSVCIDDIIKHQKEYRHRFVWYILVYAVFIGLYIWIRSFFTDYLYLSKIDITVALSIFLLMLMMISKKEIWSIFLILITLYSGETITKRYLPYVSNNVSVIPESTDSIQFLQQNAEDSPVIVVGSSWTMFANTNIYYDVKMLSGHSLSLTDSGYTNYYKAIDDKAFTTPTRIQFTKIDNYNLLKYLGVKYIVADRAYYSMNPSIIDISQLDLVYYGEDGLDIYELKETGSRFETVNNVVFHNSQEDLLSAMEQDYLPNTLHLLEENDSNNYKLNTNSSSSSDIEVVKESNDQIKLEVSNAENTFLVFNEYFNDKWKVYVNGKEQELLNGNYITRAVYLEKGNNVVEFKYEDPRIIIMMVISGGTILLSFTTLIISSKRKEKR